MARKELPPRLEQREGYWYVIHSEEGRSRRTSLRTDDLLTAQERFQGWLKQRNAFQAAQTAPTLDYAYTLYMAQHGERRTEAPETLEHVGKPLKAYFGEMQLAEITTKDIHRYTAERRQGMRVTLPDGSKLKKRPVSDGTIRKELTILRAVFNFMVNRVEPRNLRMDSRELCYIEMPARPAPRQRILSDQELKRIRDLIALPEKPAQPSRLDLYIWLLMETGARSGALRELTWKQVDFKNGFIRLNPHGREQTNKRRPIIPISEVLRPVLERAHEARHSDYVLGHDGLIRKSFDRFCEKHAFNGVTAHTFRHTFATRLAQNGVSMVEIGQLLGDSLATVEKNYLHYQPEYLRNAINRLSLSKLSALTTDETADIS